jgi:DNA excision repair protein ERCC-5
LKGLVDGVITEDSDVLLFGARKVYRNIFEKNRLVERYDMNVIEKELGLDREDLIKLALFMGSDYTPGVKGIAAVNATEIISAFPDTEGLKKFKQWVDIKQRIMETEEGETSSKKKISQKEKMTKLLENALEDDLDEDRADTEIEKEYKEKHKNWRRHWEFPEGFPSAEVIHAYRVPNVDESKEPFEWSLPCFQDLAAFALKNLNWSSRELEQYLNQVKKRLEEFQKRRKGTLETYF